MKRQFILFLTVVFLFSNVSVGSCADKENILVVIFGSPKFTKSDNIRAINEVNERFQLSFSPEYNLLIGDEYKQRFDDANIPDIVSAERADIIALFKDLDPKYIIMYELLPYRGSTGSVHLKIIDVAQNKYILNKKVIYKSTWASINGHYRQVYSNIETTIFTSFFPLIKPTVPFK